MPPTSSCSKWPRLITNRFAFSSLTQKIRSLKTLLAIKVLSTVLSCAPPRFIVRPFCAIVPASSSVTIIQAAIQLPRQKTSPSPSNSFRPDISSISNELLGDGDVFWRGRHRHHRATRSGRTSARYRTGRSHHHWQPAFHQPERV